MDETKERGLLVAAAVVVENDIAHARREVRKMILPGQRRIHFHKEREERRGQIISVLRALGAQVTIYDATRYRSVKTARDACLVALVADVAKIAAARLVLELDDSTRKADRDLLYREVRAAGVADQLRYDHMRADEECLLAIPDAVAWCWAKGGGWRAKVRPIVVDVREV
ncbi:hypothetical protein [Micromonospora echinospora]|uniref:hypothetical protein n=1 Tax=Micromonospora echinospora TaxID=1877 RepID=UPI0018D4E78F|nr:hypothetical protein [Micromonospora echinospora]